MMTSSLVLLGFLDRNCFVLVFSNPLFGGSQLSKLVYLKAEWLRVVCFYPL